MAEEKKRKPRRVNLELPQELDPTYANFAVISHTPNEVVIDFAQLLPGMPKGRVKARVVLTPTSAKMVQQALRQNLEKFEGRFGKIPGPDRQSNTFDSGSGSLGGMQWSVGSEDDDEPEENSAPPESGE
ncbi:MAG: DUF3467 domain-containing protein [Chloroflexota bacterium]|nr:DUF3467 domain-containing protein [Chloroflexota bacterium]